MKSLKCLMNLSAGEFLRLTSALSKKEFFVPQLFNFRETECCRLFSKFNEFTSIFHVFKTQFKGEPDAI